MRREDVCVLCSSGVESAALLARFLRAGAVVHPVFVRGGHAWESVELYWLKRLCRALRSPRLKPLGVLELPVGDVYRQADWSLSGKRVPSATSPDEDVYLPGRNILLLAKAGVFCGERGIERIAVGSLGSNPFPDGKPAFRRLMARAVSTGLGRRVVVEAPFERKHKEQVLREAPPVPWELTFSCIAPRGKKHCGRCNKCAERRAAFREAGIADPTRYS